MKLHDLKPAAGAKHKAKNGSQKLVAHTLLRSHAPDACFVTQIQHYTIFNRFIKFVSVYVFAIMPPIFRKL